MQQHVYFVGSEAEIGHHASPLADSFDFQIVEPARINAIARPGDIAIFYSEHFDRFRDAIRGLQSANVATLYMIDGILEWRNAWENRADELACPFTMRPALSDKVACIGAAQARVLDSWGNEGKVEIVGVPRFDKLKKLKKRERSAEVFRLMVLSAKCPSYTDADCEELHRSLEDIRDYADRAKADTEVVWRLTAGWDQRIGVENSVTDLTGKELASQLATVDAVITTPSTAALESMLLDLPTAVIDYTNSPSYVRSAWHISALNQLEIQIAELKSPPESKMVFQRQVLADELYLDSEATNRMSELVAAMLAATHECVLRGERNQFTGQMLEAPLSSGSKIAGFAPAVLFPEFPEFQMEDATELQTELAHSRREIANLNSQLEQLQKELTDAHQVFDEINGHPIAGPIVRVRQMLIDAMKKIKKNDIQTDAD